MYGLEPSSISLLGFGAVVVIGAILMYLVSLFSMKETSFEDVLEEQRRKKEKEDKERSMHNKQKRDQYKKKFEQKKKKGNVGNGKVEKIDSGVSPMHEVQIKETPELDGGEPAQAAPKKSKKAAKKQDQPAPQPKEDSTKPSHPILKQTPGKEKKEVEVVQATHAQSAPKPSAKSDEKNKVVVPKKKEEVGRTRTVSFSDEVNDKTKQDAEVEKSKKKKKKAEPEVENAVVAQLRDAALGDRDVQNVLTIIKQKYGIDVGGGTKIKDLQHQLDQLKKQLSKSEGGLQQYVDRCMKAENTVEQLKQDLTFENTKFTSLEKAMQDLDQKHKKDISMLQTHHLAEVKQLKDKLALSGDYDEMRKTAEKLKTENTILMAEIQKNAAVVAENSRLSGDLQQAKHNLQETQRRCSELEAKVSEYHHHSDNIAQQKVEIEQKYLHQMNEQSHNLQQLQQKYSVLDNEYQKVKGELQTTQSHSASLLDQVTVLTEENESKYAAQSAVHQQLADAEKLVENRDATIHELSSQNSELLTQVKNLEQQVGNMTSQIDSLSQEVKDKADAVSQSTEGSQEEQQKLKEELEAVKEESKKFKEEIDKLKKKNNDLRERSWKAMDAVNSLEKSIPEKVSAAQEEADQRCKDLEQTVRKALSDSFPDISSNEKDFRTWVSAFLNDASAMTSQQQVQSSEHPQLEEAEREAEKLRSEVKEREAAADELRARISKLENSLSRAEEREREVTLSTEKNTAELENARAESNKYKNILNTTEKILSELQSSVEAEEGVWKKKVEEARRAHQDAEDLRKTIEELKSDNSSLLETSKECENLRHKLDEMTSRVSELEENLARKEAITSNGASEEDNQPSQSEVIVQVEQPLTPVHQLDKHQQCESTPTKTVSCQSDSPVQVEYSDACTDTGSVLEQQDMDGFLVIEHVNIEEERLEKEKTLTKNLGQAATKLQTVLKHTQEQLNSEREKSSELENKLANLPNDQILVNEADKPDPEGGTSV